MVGSEIKMNEDKVIQYTEDCKKSGNLDYPLAGSMRIPKCKICKNADFKYGTWDEPVCLFLKAEMPEDLLRCITYKCEHFIHDKTSKFNQFFDENLNPLLK